MQNARSTLVLITLAAATLAASIFGPRVGGPDPAIIMTVLFSSLLSSIAGFAFTAICGGILFHLWDDHLRIVQLMIASSIASQVAMVLSLRSEIPWRQVSRYVIGGLCGAPAGIWALLHVDHARFGQLVGGFLLAYAGFVAIGRPRARQSASPLGDVVVGLAGGLIGGATALPSLPVTIWCQLRGCDKLTMRAIGQPFILAMQITSLALLSIEDPARNMLTAAPDVLCVPAALFGTQIGMGCYRGLTERQFTFAVTSLLVVCGLNFVL